MLHERETHETHETNVERGFCFSPSSGRRIGARTEDSLERCAVTFDEISSFMQTLPPAYQTSQPEAVRREHWTLSRSRRQTGALIQLSALGRAESADALTLCLVAEDRPGLLSAITAALARGGLDILHAETLTRACPGHPPEAVDVFLLERQADPNCREPLSKEELAAIRAALGGLLEGRLKWTSAVAQNALAPMSDRTGTRVRFLEDDEGALSVLEVETGNRSGLLLALARAFAAQEVTILRSEVRTDAARVLDRFTLVELNGDPISEERRLQVQVAVLSAVDSG